MKGIAVVAAGILALAITPTFVEAVVWVFDTAF